MKCAFAVIFSVLVLLLNTQQSLASYSDTTEDLADALWTDTSSMSDMTDICRFLLRNGNSDMDPETADRINLNVYKSLYALLAYINKPLLEEALIKQMEFRCRQQLLQQQLILDQENVYKRSENEKVVGKKVKFHSWGGKRTGGTGNEDIIPNPSYRAKFHSWGGKRSVPVAKEVAQ